MSKKENRNKSGQPVPIPMPLIFANRHLVTKALCVAMIIVGN